jgi:CTP synthase
VVDRIQEPARGKVVIGVVGKYVHLRDSYKSLHEALVHGGLANDCSLELRYIDSEEVERNGAAEMLAGVDGLLVPGGFGDRGVEGKVLAVKHARETELPFFGICLGMQVAVIEFARNVCGLQGANSTEFNDKTPHPVVDLMPDQRGVTDKGATMRLGAYPCILTSGSVASEAYGGVEISERHRHRYELNNTYRDELTKSGLVLSGLSPDRRLVEMVELPSHPYFVGCQFHPEFKSRPLSPHPLFTRFVRAALEQVTRRRAETSRNATTVN